MIDAKKLAGAAVLTLALAVPAMSVPALADVVVHRGHGVRHVHRTRVVVVPRRAVRVVGPAKYVPLQPDEFVDPENPGYRRGVDDGSRYDSAADGIALGREEPVPGRRDLGILPVSSYRAPGYEIEGPPIGASLPVVPELYDPRLY